MRTSLRSVALSSQYSDNSNLARSSNIEVAQPSIIRLGILLLLFDVYLTWARIERQSAPDADSASGGNFGRLAQQPIVFQYLFFRTILPPHPPTSGPLSSTGANIHSPYLFKNQ